jgi:hypothetical protein
MSEVYKAILGVQGSLAKQGISKSRQNKMQNFMFRGIDDIYGAISPLLVEYGLCILPVITSISETETKTEKGTVMHVSRVEVEYHFVSAKDESAFIVKVYGQAADSGDKATAKAASAAYKTAMLQAFHIPTEAGSEEPDADETQTITEQQVRYIEATIGDVAKTEEIDRNLLRDKVKAGCLKFLGVGHFKEVPSDKMDLVLDRILPKAIEYARAGGKQS